MAKVIDHGMAKPDAPVYTAGPIIGGIRFHNPPKKPKVGDAEYTILDAIAAITPEQAEEHERTMARRRAEAVAKGQDPMQPYADDMEEVLFRTVEEELRSGKFELEKATNK
jgi:hypothetical protein